MLAPGPQRHKAKGSAFINITVAAGPNLFRGAAPFTEGLKGPGPQAKRPRDREAGINDSNHSP